MFQRMTMALLPFGQIWGNYYEHDNNGHFDRWAL